MNHEGHDDNVNHEEHEEHEDHEGNQSHGRHHRMRLPSPLSPPAEEAISEPSVARFGCIGSSVRGSLRPVAEPRVFLHRCLHKDPKQRVGDIRDVRLALEGAFEVLDEVGRVPRSGPADGAGSAGAIHADPAYVRSIRRRVLLVGAAP